MEPPLTFRPKTPDLVKRIDAACAVHGWNRTTYILRAITDALARDEDVYAPAPEVLERIQRQRAEKTVKVREWRRRTNYGRNR